MKSYQLSLNKKQIMCFLKPMFFILCGVGFAGIIFAAPSAPVSMSLGAVSDTIKSNFSAVAKLITAAAYIAGFGFAFAAILKFKAHKDNPTQIPVGTPIALLFIAAALIFLPSILTVGGKTVFGSHGRAGGISGTSSVGSFSK
jgi:intracellular multiplication protein IcmD